MMSIVASPILCVNNHNLKIQNLVDQTSGAAVNVTHAAKSNTNPMRSLNESTNEMVDIGHDCELLLNGLKNDADMFNGHYFPKATVRFDQVDRSVKHCIQPFVVTFVKDRQLLFTVSTLVFSTGAQSINYQRGKTENFAAVHAS